MQGIPGVPVSPRSRIGCFGLDRLDRYVRSALSRAVDAAKPNLPPIDVLVRRTFQNIHIPMRSNIWKTLQLPSLFSRQHFENRSTRDSGRVARSNSLAWQKYLLGPIDVLRRVRSCSTPAKCGFDSRFASFTLRVQAPPPTTLHA